VALSGPCRLRQAIQTMLDARLPEASFFEFDLSKIKGLLGYEPEHAVGSEVETAEVIRRRKETRAGMAGWGEENWALAGV